MTPTLTLTVAAFRFTDLRLIRVDLSSVRQPLFCQQRVSLLNHLSMLFTSCCLCTYFCLLISMCAIFCSWKKKEKEKRGRVYCVVFQISLGHLKERKITFKFNPLKSVMNLVSQSLCQPWMWWLHSRLPSDTVLMLTGVLAVRRCAIQSDRGLHFLRCRNVSVLLPCHLVRVLPGLPFTVVVSIAIIFIFIIIIVSSCSPGAACSDAGLAVDLCH